MPGKFPHFGRSKVLANLILIIKTKTLWLQSPFSAFVYSKDSLVPLLQGPAWQPWNELKYPTSRVRTGNTSRGPLWHCDTLLRIKSAHRYLLGGKWYSPCSYTFHINGVPILGSKNSLWSTADRSQGPAIWDLQIHFSVSHLRQLLPCEEYW